MEQRFLPGMSPGLVRVAESARRNPGPQLSLAHHIDVEALRRAYSRIRKKASVGVDGITKEQYGENLEENLQDLHQRLKSMCYRHQPIRRVHIEKEGGTTRPIGISTVEDKLVQDSLRELLEVIYEQDFMDCSYGFRPGRRAMDALRTLDRTSHCGGANWVLEADIVSFFDRIDRRSLKVLLQKRLADKSLMRLIGKCLSVNVLDGSNVLSPETGTVQGSTLSPLLANVYLHYILDQWFEQEVRPRMRGAVTLIRYCDDFIMCFKFKSDAERVRVVLAKRLARFGLDLHPEKTRLIDFRRPLRNQSGKWPETFDFLGFTVLWKQSRRGSWYMGIHTCVKRLRQTKKVIYDWCRRYRWQPIKSQHASLVQRIRGHINYFGVRGNERRLSLLIEATKRSWFKWLNRRSQRSTLNWDRFVDLLRDYPLPKPEARYALWG